MSIVIRTSDINVLFFTFKQFFLCNRYWLAFRLWCNPWYKPKIDCRHETFFTKDIVLCLLILHNYIYIISRSYLTRFVKSPEIFYHPTFTFPVTTSLIIICLRSCKRAICLLQLEMAFLKFAFLCSI